MLMKALVERRRCGRRRRWRAASPSPRRIMHARRFPSRARSTPTHVALGVADQVERHPLDEELRARAHVALVERVQHRVAGAVGRGAARAAPASRRSSPSGRRTAAGRSCRRRCGRTACRSARARRRPSAPSRHMNSIASWSPSQSEPLTVSYMCQSQLSSRHVAERRADAALRRDRVRARREHLGQHGDAAAPPRASCSDARMPAPPAPTITASNWRVGSFIGNLAALAVAASWPPHRTWIVQPA